MADESAGSPSAVEAPSGAATSAADTAASRTALEGTSRTPATVLSGLDFSKKEWGRYHKAMCDFRNKYVAHHEQGFSQPVPDFEPALQIAYAYDDWIRELIQPDEYTGPRLQEEFDTWHRQATPISEKAMTATYHVKG